PSPLVAKHIEERREPSIQLLLPSSAEIHPQLWNTVRTEWKEKSGEVVLEHQSATPFGVARGRTRR
ncbi:MAG TPA: hypothetical protein VJT73_21900, partial [Polyangiaceae bacterium]|nr:hypothetical protein [Polyangiaceae bacterium]